MQLTTGFALLTFATSAFAQLGVWQECGGIEFVLSGLGVCVAGTICTKLSDNYSACMPAKPKYWFSFGDSYSRTGFNVSGVQPNPGNPLGNPPYPGATSSGGVNWVDVVTAERNKTLTLTYNFAIGGATIEATLPTEVNSFLDSVGQKPTTAAWTSEGSLFSFWAGINDIGGSYLQVTDRETFSDTLLDTYFGLVQKTFDVGARHFLFINIPPMDRTPLMLARPATDRTTEAAIISTFNSKLVQRVNSFKATHFGVTAKVWDAHSAFITVLDNPQKYGFVDAMSIGGAGDFWWNSYHPSAAAHEIWGKQVAALLD